MSPKDADVSFITHNIRRFSQLEAQPDNDLPIKPYPKVFNTFDLCMCDVLGRKAAKINQNTNQIMSGLIFSKFH